MKTPWYHIGIDFIGPITPPSPSGNCYILTICDYCTKWAEAFATSNKSAPQTAQALFKLRYANDLWASSRTRTRVRVRIPWTDLVLEQN